MRKPHAAIAHVGGLSNPSKMPGFSWSIPAETCKLGAMLARIPGTTCHGCYALKGCYQFPSTQRAMRRRYAILMQVLGSPLAEAEFVAAWSEIFAYRLRQTERRLARTGKIPADDGQYWRWHDSGDLQSAEHLRIYCAIADNAPGVAFWLPTREIGFVAGYLRSGGVIPPNSCVRLSSPRVDDAPSGLMRKLAAESLQISYSGVHVEAPPEGMQECAAYQQEGFCNSQANGNCRACWDDTRDISYPLH